MENRTFEQRLDDLGDRVRPQIAQAKKQISQVNSQVTTFIQDHPAACLLGALGIGYLVARLARRHDCGAT